MKIRKLHIENFKNLKDFDIDFSDENGNVPSLIVIAGQNGSGKSSLLLQIYSLFFKEEFFEKGKDWVEIENDDKQIKTIRKFPDITGKTKIFSRHYSEIRQSNIKNLKSLIVNSVKNEVFERNGVAENVYSQIREMLSSINFGLQVEFHGIDRNEEVIFRNHLAKFPFESLSDGEQTLMTHVLTLLIAKEQLKNTILLIDEPESSLHPAWQSRIAPFYQKFAEENNCQIILATHSPHIVSSVRKEQIRVLAKDENDKTIVMKNFLNSYGKPVDEILIDIFGLNSLRTPEVEEKLERLDELKSQFDSEEFQQKSEELEKILGYSDRELVRIRFDVELLKRKRNEKNK